MTQYSGFNLNESVLYVYTIFIAFDTLNESNIHLFLYHYDFNHQYNVDYERWNSPNFVKVEKVIRPDSGNLNC